MKKIISFFFVLLLSVAAVSAKNTPTESMHCMVMRLFPAHANFFVFQQISSDKDCFILQSVGNKVKISGNNANSMAVGLNYYLKNYCLTTVSWFLADPLELPKVLPHVKDLIKITVKVPVRFFLNYCTYGYTMPWWSWKDWERFIDWMALNGINRPLAITGQEAVWYNVWKKFGMTDKEIRSYFTGPAHLPWHRMCNVDMWQGPLPMSWIEGQKILQKQIVDRERELNMKPILPAFSGHVPATLKKLYPNIHTTEVASFWGSWGGFAPKYHCSFLNPMDSLYNVIQKEYLTEQTKLYGTDHIYGVDPFNEVNPPTWKPDSLAMISSHIYQSMAAVDKDAVWLQMAWLFVNDSTHWTPACKKALVRSVPQGKMLLLDYFCENTEVWSTTESFYGQPFIWCYLGNFGGTTAIYGPIKKVSERLANTFQHGGNNFVGIGATLEGLDLNMFAYEFTLDKAWNMPQNDTQWLENLADRRLGVKNAAARQAWKSLSNNVLENGTPIVIENRPTLKGGNVKDAIYPDEIQEALLTAWRKLLSVPNENRATYCFDVVNIGRQVLECHFQHLYDGFIQAYEKNDISNLKSIGADMKNVLKDIDVLVACNPTFSLKNWIKNARVMGKDAIEKDYFEKNARTIITVWGDSTELTDYARRGWAGLISNYYAPRWIKFIDEVTEAVEQHKTFDEKVFTNECFIMERNFIEPSHSIVYPKSENAIVMAKILLKKYFQ
jgi:alpha-N-acetylglucosaminidase